MQEQEPARRTPRVPDRGRHRAGRSDPAAAAGAEPVLRTGLRQNSLGLLGVTMQAITHIAPAIAALFFTQFIVSLAGITAPLAYVVGIVVLMLGNTLVQFSKHLPSAGGTTPTSAAR